MVDQDVQRFVGPVPLVSHPAVDRRLDRPGDLGERHAALAARHGEGRFAAAAEIDPVALEDAHAEGIAEAMSATVVFSVMTT
jgi:hypothetical protein